VYLPASEEPAALLARSVIDLTAKLGDLEEQLEALQREYDSYRQATKDWAAQFRVEPVSFPAKERQ
jgi:hypothetical protein